MSKKSLSLKKIEAFAKTLQEGDKCMVIFDRKINVNPFAPNEQQPVPARLIITFKAWYEYDKMFSFDIGVLDARYCIEIYKIK